MKSPLQEKKPRSGARDFFYKIFRTKPTSAVGMVILLFFLFIAIFANFLAPDKMVDGALPHSLLNSLAAPSAQHWLGTDTTGRDVLSYMIYGARTSVILALSCTAISTVISIIIGVSSAVIGGKFDLLLQRFIDAFQCIPPMLITLIMMSMLGAGMLQMIIVLSIPPGIGGSRLIRGTAIPVKESGYVKMSDMLGSGYVWKMWKHVIPNIMPIILMNLAGSIGGVIMMEATLNFLGFGVDIGTPSWGAMLTGQGQSNLYRAPWLALSPGLAITAIVFASAIFGDGVRDILDPRLKGGAGGYSTKKLKKVAAKFATAFPEAFAEPKLKD